MVVPQYPYPVVGGLERQAHELAKSLLERGCQVQALSGAYWLTPNQKNEIMGMPISDNPALDIHYFPTSIIPVDDFGSVHLDDEDEDLKRVLKLHSH